MTVLIIILALLVGAVILMAWEAKDERRKMEAYRQAAIHFARQAGHTDPLLAAKAAFQAAYDVMPQNAAKPDQR